MRKQGHHYIVLGAGRQGVAAAYDLLQFGEADSVTLADADAKIVEAAAQRLRALVKGSKAKVAAKVLDASSAKELEKALKGQDAVLCALPYRFNAEVAKAAVAQKVPYCDLGGHMGTTKKVLKLDSAAKKAGIALVPDCGLAPGLANSLAVCGMRSLDICNEIKIYCGGLPQNRELPLGYKLVYNLDGLLGIYTEKAQALKLGKIVTLEPLSAREEIEFPSPLGILEAFVTAGGVATCPWTFEKRLRGYEYKTLRYPGHLAQFRALLDLGLFETEPVAVNGGKVTPLHFTAKILQQKLHKPSERDLVILRVVCRGEHGGRPTDLVYELLDFEDPQTHFSAMERTTGFSAAVVAWMLASGVIKVKGAVPPETAIPGPEFLKEIRRRGLKVRETLRARA
jgi:lysine 6-dehydrogenase